jgi:hypothetical protein
MTDEELKKLVASIAVAQKETDKQIKETNKETNKQLKELGKQIGGLGRKFGSFTEGLALPSMEHILKNRFKMEVISPYVKVERAGKNFEIDVLAYANSKVNEVYIVEVKSHLREEGITQLQNLVTHFKQLFPEHNDKKVFGILAAVNIPAALKQRILSLGFYVANVRDELFSLDVPDDFHANAY